MRIRLGGPDDVAWAMALAPELASFGLPPWRDYDVFVEECRKHIRAGLENDRSDDIVFIAVDGSDRRSGLAHVLLVPDANSGGRNVFINDLVVEPAFQGQGIGSALLRRCERWGREHNAVGLVLAVFQDNVGARRLYEQYGFRDDVVRVVRPLGDDSSEPSVT